jgi:hypothetical protein
LRKKTGESMPSVKRPGDAKDFKKCIPKGFGIRVFALGARPLSGKGGGADADFVPADGHVRGGGVVVGGNVCADYQPRPGIPALNQHLEPTP